MFVLSKWAAQWPVWPLPGPAADMHAQLNGLVVVQPCLCRACTGMSEVTTRVPIEVVKHESFLVVVVMHVMYAVPLQEHDWCNKCRQG